MASNFYDQFMDAQKSMFNTWNNYMNPMIQKEKETEPENADYFQDLQQLNREYMKQFMNNPSDSMKYFLEKMNPFKNAKMGGIPLGNIYDMMSADPMDNMWKNMMGFNQLLMNQSFDNPQDIWKKMNASFDNYISAYQLWKKLSDASDLTPQKMEDIYSDWSEQYNKYMKNYFIPTLPKEFQEVTAKYLDAGNAFGDTMQSLARPFAEDAMDIGTFMLDFAKKGPAAYMDYLNSFTDSAKESLDYLMTTPFAMYNEDFLKTQEKLMDRQAQYQAALTKYYDKVGSVFKNAAKDAMDEFTKVMDEGMEPKSFEEFYKFWTEKRNEYVENAYLSEEFNNVVEETLNAMATFKEENADILREYYSFLKIPNKNDMDNLENTVKDLTAKIEEMNKEISDLKTLVKENKRF